MKRQFLLFLMLLTFGWLGCSGSNGTNGMTGSGQPSISAFNPAQVSRGDQNTTGTITGSNLGAATSVTLGPDVTVLSFSSASSSEIDVKFSVSVNASPGPRTISITTTGGTATNSTALTVSSHRAPVAAFTVSAKEGAVNAPLAFDASGSQDPDGTISKYAWSFGDGASGSGVRTQHTYANTGIFPVSLTVSDGQGQGSVSRSISVVNGVPPTPHFTVSPASGSVDTLFTFDASASTDDGKITVYAWSFGDGGKAQGVRVTHKFSEGGNFSVSLTLTDNTGLQRSTNRQLKVDSFNNQAATEEINKLIERFFRRYSELDHLSAVVIVEGWSIDPNCTARAHEIDIIQKQQQTITSTSATITKTDIYIHEDHRVANADVQANFDWIDKDGTHHTGSASHHFTLILEGGIWQICDFYLS